MADDKSNKKTTSVSISKEMFKKCNHGPDSIRSQLNGLRLWKNDDGDDVEIIHAAPIINALISTFDLKAQGKKVIDYIKNVHNKDDGRSKEAIKARKAEADRKIAELEAIIKEQQAAERKSPKKKAPAKKPTKSAKAKAAAELKRKEKLNEIWKFQDKKK